MDTDIYNHQYLKQFFDELEIDVEGLRNMKARIWGIDAFDENHPWHQEQLRFKEEYVMPECWVIEAELEWAAYFEESTFRINLFHGMENSVFIISAIVDLCLFFRHETGQAEHYEPRRYSNGATFAPEVPAKQMQAFLLEKFQLMGKPNGFHTLRVFAEDHLKAIEENLEDESHFAEVAETFPVVARYISFLKEVAEGRELDNSTTDTFTPPEGSEDSTEMEIDSTQQNVANILEPLREVFQNEKDFNDAVKRLCRYFQRKEQYKASKIWVARGKKLRLAKVLGRIHRKVDNVNPLGWEYQKTIVGMFDCFDPKDLTEKGNGGFSNTNLHNYMTRGANIGG